MARHANEIADGVYGVFDSMFGNGPATFGNSYGAVDSGPAVSRANDPYAWAQRLRDIPDGEPGFPFLSGLGCCTHPCTCCLESCAV